MQPWRCALNQIIGVSPATVARLKKDIKALEFKVSTDEKALEDLLDTLESLKKQLRSSFYNVNHNNKIRGQMSPLQDKIKVNEQLLAAKQKKLLEYKTKLREWEGGPKLGNTCFFFWVKSHTLILQMYSGK